MNNKTMLITAIVIAAIIIISVFVLFPQKSKYETSLELAGEWFLNNQDENFLHYQYNPVTQEHSTDPHPLREMASMWSIAALSNYLKDPELDVLAHRGFDYFEQYFVYDSENDFYYVNATPNNLRLGDSAFIILTLVEMDHPKKDYYLEKFANGILHQQNENGSLSTFFYSDRTSGIDYYPGEALFALMSLYEYNKDDRYLEAVGRAFPYYHEYWFLNSNTAFVPWQSRAYSMYYKATQDPEIADYVFNMNDIMLDWHYPQGDCTDFDFSRGIVTGVYLEGVNQAYELAVKLKHDRKIMCYSNFIREGTDAMLELQVTNTTDEHALGGFMGTSTSKRMRVDRNQHAIFALIDALELKVLK